MAYKDKKVQSKYQSDRNKRLRKEWCNNNGPCKKCGSRENLEVDHIDPEIKVSHSIWSWKEERRNLELLKCQVLCKGCHLEKTIRQINEAHPLVHGTLAGYKSKKHKCRCADCKKANALWKTKNQITNQGVV